MAIFKDRTVPVPNVKGITINRGDKNKVLFSLSASYNANLGYTKAKRTVIGYITENDEHLMHPTDKFKDIFPKLWEDSFDEKPEALIKKIGMYTLGQAVNQKVGIKDILDSSFDFNKANKIMDYSLYSILYSSSVTSKFSTKMENQMLYSQKTL